MKEIKFRIAWFDFKTNKFSHFTYWGRIDHKDNHSSDCFTSPGSSSHHYPKEDQQYIGLKDKNGKEIYGGDIKRWKFNNHDWLFVCYWSDIDCGFRWKLIKHNEKRSNYPDIYIQYDTEKDFYDYIINSNQRDNGFDSWSTLIGNIYENPELLK